MAVTSMISNTDGCPIGDMENSRSLVGGTSPLFSSFAALTSFGGLTGEPEINVK